MCSRIAEREICNVDILLLKKEAKLSASYVAGFYDGNDEDDWSFHSLPEAFGVFGGRTNEVRVIVFLDNENEFVILVVQRLKGGQVKSRVGALPKVFCMANSGAK